MDAAFLIAFLAPAFFHLGARAKLTAPIHQRYPAWLDGFMNCAACAGAWYAMILAVAFYVAGWPIFATTSWLAIPMAGLASIWWTPIAVNLQEQALVQLSMPAYDELPPVAASTVFRLQLEGLAVEARTVAQRADVSEIIAIALSRIAQQAEDLVASLPARDAVIEPLPVTQGPWVDVFLVPYFDQLHRINGWTPATPIGVVFVEPARADEMLAAHAAIEIKPDDLATARASFEGRPDPHGFGPTAERTRGLITLMV